MFLSFSCVTFAKKSLSLERSSRHLWGLWLPAKRWGRRGNMGFHHLRPSRSGGAGWRYKSDSNLVTGASNDLAAGFEAIQLDNEIEGVRRGERSLDLQARPRFGDAADHTGQGGVSVVEGNNASFEHAPALAFAPFPVRVVNDVRCHDPNEPPGSVYARAPNRDACSLFLCALGRSPCGRVSSSMALMLRSGATPDASDTPCAPLPDRRTPP